MDPLVLAMYTYAINALCFAFFTALGAWCVPPPARAALGAWRCGDHPLEGSFSLQTTAQPRQQEHLSHGSAGGRICRGRFAPKTLPASTLGRVEEFLSPFSLCRLETGLLRLLADSCTPTALPALHRSPLAVNVGTLDAGMHKTDVKTASKSRRRMTSFQ